MTCPGCGTSWQPNEGRPTCYTCGSRLGYATKTGATRYLVCAPPDDGSGIPDTMRPSTAWASEEVKPEPENAVLESLVTLIDALALENAKPSRIRLGWCVFIAYSRRCGVIAANSTFEHAGIKFSCSPTQHGYDIEVSHE